MYNYYLKARIKVNEAIELILIFEQVYVKML